MRILDYNMSYEIVLGGLALGGLGVYGAKYLSKQRKLAAEARRVREEEEVGIKKAQGSLLAASYYSELEGLRRELDGQMILPTDGEKYHACRRRAFNQNQRGYPHVIVRVESVKDISNCVKFAAKHRKDLVLCVASGCHSSKCMMDGAFIIDLFKWNKAELNTEKTTVSVQGGAYLGEIDKVLYPHNLGVTVGTYPETGVGGLVLGGGYGFLARMYGFSVDNLLECEVVLPTGEVVVANDTQNADLMWGLRGGSGNFGVVTKFVFRVHKLPPYTLAGVIAKLTPTHRSAVTVATNFDKLLSTVPDNMAAYLVFPGGAPVSPTVWAHFGDAKTAEEVPLLQKAKNLGEWINVQNSVKLCSYHKDVQTLTTPLVESGHVYHTLIQFGKVDEELPTEFFDKLLTFTRAKLHPTLHKAILIGITMGGQQARSDPSGQKTCLAPAIRQARYFGVVEVYWKPECGEEGKNAARDWARGVAAILKPYHDDSLRYASSDASTQSADASLYKEGDQAGYGSEIIPKLRALKSKYDPTNLFKNNVNILPA